MSAVEELERRFGIPGVARVSEGHGALLRIHITGSRGEGEMSLHTHTWRRAQTDSGSERQEILGSRL